MSRSPDKGSWRNWLATALALVVTVVAITVALSGGDAAKLDSAKPSDSTSGNAKSGQARLTGSTLVTRMLDDLRSGRKTESQDEPLAGASIKVVRASPDDPFAIAELSIPAIDLRTKVFEGVNEAALEQGPGHWPGTPALGQPGNFVLSGHRSTETRPFLHLDRLARGDVITMTQGSSRYRYAVDSVTIVPEKKYVPYVLKRPDKPNAQKITLFACNPITAHYQRIVVRAHALDGRAQS
jgi:sortase A